METRLLASETGQSLPDIAHWANSLIGQPVPGEPRSIVICIRHFQIISDVHGHAAMVLAEVTDRPTEPQVALREADIEVIEELTATIDEEV